MGLSATEVVALRQQLQAEMTKAEVGHALNVFHGLGDEFDLLTDGHPRRRNDRAKRLLILAF